MTRDRSADSSFKSKGAEVRISEERIKIEKKLKEKMLKKSKKSSSRKKRVESPPKPIEVEVESREVDKRKRSGNSGSSSDSCKSINRRILDEFEQIKLELDDFIDLMLSLPIKITDEDQFDTGTLVAIHQRLEDLKEHLVHGYHDVNLTLLLTIKDRLEIIHTAYYNQAKTQHMSGKNVGENENLSQIKDICISCARLVQDSQQVIDGHIRMGRLRISSHRKATEKHKKRSEKAKVEPERDESVPELIAIEPGTIKKSTFNELELVEDILEELVDYMHRLPGLQLPNPDGYLAHLQPMMVWLGSVIGDFSNCIYHVNAANLSKVKQIADALLSIYAAQAKKKQPLTQDVDSQVENLTNVLQVILKYVKQLLEIVNADVVSGKVEFTFEPALGRMSHKKKKKSKSHKSSSARDKNQNVPIDPVAVEPESNLDVQPKSRLVTPNDEVERLDKMLNEIKRGLEENMFETVDDLAELQQFFLAKLEQLDSMKLDVKLKGEKSQFLFDLLTYVEKLSNWLEQRFHYLQKVNDLESDLNEMVALSLDPADIANTQAPIQTLLLKLKRNFGDLHHPDYLTCIHKLSQLEANSTDYVTKKMAAQLGNLMEQAVGDINLTRTAEDMLSNLNERDLDKKSPKSLQDDLTLLKGYFITLAKDNPQLKAFFKSKTHAEKRDLIVQIYNNQPLVFKRLIKYLKLRSRKFSLLNKSDQFSEIENRIIAEFGEQLYIGSSSSRTNTLSSSDRSSISSGILSVKSASDTFKISTSKWSPVAGSYEEDDYFDLGMERIQMNLPAKFEHSERSPFCSLDRRAGEVTPPQRSPPPRAESSEVVPFKASNLHNDQSTPLVRPIPVQIQNKPNEDCLENVNIKFEHKLGDQVSKANFYKYSDTDTFSSNLIPNVKIMLKQNVQTPEMADSTPGIIIAKLTVYEVSKIVDPNLRNDRMRLLGQFETCIRPDVPFVKKSFLDTAGNKIHLKFKAASHPTQSNLKQN